MSDHPNILLIEVHVKFTEKADFYLYLNAKAESTLRAIVLMVFTQNPAWRPPSVRLTSFQQQKEVSKKCRSPKYVLLPIIRQI